MITRFLLFNIKNSLKISRKNIKRQRSGRIEGKEIKRHTYRRETEKEKEGKR